jgi:S-adenosyl methyltransferase
VLMSKVHCRTVMPQCSSCNDGDIEDLIQGAWMGKLAVGWPEGVSRGDGPPEWSTAGIRDFWLGGSRHTATDRDIAEHILVGTPYLPYMVRAYRALLGRVVRYLVGVGVEQFLDLGSGLPTAGNVHDVTQALNPGCRVVYVDIAPDIVAVGHHVLAGNDSAAMVCADLRHPEQALDAAQRTGLLDLDAPVAVLLIDVLHHIPDTDNPTRFIHTYVDAVCPGSHVAVAHPSDGDALLSGLAMFHRFYQIPIPPLTFRDSAQFEDFFRGLDLVEPGIVPIPLWRPEQDKDADTDPEHFPGWCALGRRH